MNDKTSNEEKIAEVCRHDTVAEAAGLSVCLDCGQPNPGQIAPPLSGKQRERLATIVNPEAVGDPDQTPVVHLSPDLVRLLNPCRCGGVNGFHKAECDRAEPQS
jgi:hypothetical protein